MSVVIYLDRGSTCEIEDCVVCPPIRTSKPAHHDCNDHDVMNGEAGQAYTTVTTILCDYQWVRQLAKCALIVSRADKVTENRA